jgi:hypothetical protein
MVKAVTALAIAGADLVPAPSQATDKLRSTLKIVVRYEYHADNFLGMVQLGGSKILFRLFRDGLH